jgi:Cu(I)/Ag(I) efflux system membrane protein CusA/SilA
MVRQYQIVLDPERLRAYNIPHAKVIDAVQRANQETGGSVLELGEAEYMVRASGYLQSLDDFRKIRSTTTDAGVSVRWATSRASRSARDAPRHRGAQRRRRGRRRHHRDALGQERARDHRRGEGEDRDAQAEPAAGRRDRADLRPLEPDQARGRNLAEKLVEEFIVVALVCLCSCFTCARRSSRSCRCRSAC